MNKGTYGYPLPPNKATLVAPPEWRNYKLLTATTSSEVVPQNVYQMLVMVWGAGANGSGSNGTGGAGAGFAMAIIDVVPGQALPTITVGSTAGASSSFGALISATGGSGYSSPGSGSVVSGLRGAFTAQGGLGGSSSNGSGGASGSPYGKGGDGNSNNPSGGGAWGNSTAPSGVPNGAIPFVSSAVAMRTLVDIANRAALPLPYAPTTTAITPPGCGGYGMSGTDGIGKHATLGGGGGSLNTATGGNGGFLGGGAGAGSTGGTFGPGGVMLCWTEGY